MIQQQRRLNLPSPLPGPSAQDAVATGPNWSSGLVESPPAAPGMLQEPLIEFSWPNLWPKKMKIKRVYGRCIYVIISYYTCIILV